MENNNKKEIAKQLKELSKTHGKDVYIHHELPKGVVIVQNNGRINRLPSHNLVFRDIHGNKIGTPK